MSLSVSRKRSSRVLSWGIVKLRCMVLMVTRHLNDCLVARFRARGASHFCHRRGGAEGAFAFGVALTRPPLRHNVARRWREVLAMDRKAKLLDEIERRRDDLVALTRALVRIPSINPPGDCYREICDFLATRLRRKGFAIEVMRAEGTPGDSDRFPRWNVVARREGAGPGECVHFNSHTDVVLPGQGWTFDPFGGEIQDGRIYGRGTCDMKGGLAASIIAAEAFIDVFPDFAGAIEISGTADEETGGYGGVAYLAQKGYFSPERVQHVVIPEPLNKDRICLGHRGVWWAEIETKGRIAHGSMPFLGDSAIRHMGAVLA